eukprot:6365630-Prorocentrum_lima.AAC.1
MAGTLAGHQTVPRAELQTFIQAAANIKGPFTYYTDSAIGVKGWNKCVNGNIPRNNPGDWLELLSHCHGRKNLITVVKIKSHQDANPVAPHEWQH